MMIGESGLMEGPHSRHAWVAFLLEFLVRLKVHCHFG